MTASPIDAEEFRRVRAICEAAFDLAGAARARHLDAACAGDAKLRAEVERLLALDSGGGAVPALLDSPAAAALPFGAPGSSLGGFRIVRCIASGGMGTVYQAEQHRPRRIVALKTLRVGLGSPEAVRRFQYESEVLGRLSHPNVAQVFASGVEEFGGVAVPWLAMELIEPAQALGEFANRRALGQRERLELFRAVAAAVHYAHTQGVIHRDLKPSNILVDAAGRPRVIDFGVARAADAAAEGTTMHTAAGALVGTLQYMSPEQFDSDPGAVDGRADVYSLGVILFELLCGRLPHELSGKSLTEIARTVREDPPLRPSLIDAHLKGDLESIVLKALEIDRDRRYASARDFADDLGRYLRHEPVAAAPQSLAYRTAKFVRRHRAGVAAGTAIAGALLAGAVLALTGFLEARDANERLAEQLAATRAEAAKATAVNGFLNQMLRMASPIRFGSDVRLADVLDAAAGMVGPEFRQQPVIGGILDTSLGTTYRQLAETERADQHLSAAHAALLAAAGPEARETLSAANELAILRLDQNRLDEAEGLIDGALARARQALGPEDPLTLSIETNRSALLAARGRTAEAAEVAERMLDLRNRLAGPDSDEALVVRNNLALLRSELGDLVEAEHLLREALEGCRRRYGDDHLSTLEAKRNLADFLRNQSRFGEAEQLLRETLAGLTAKLGAKHPSAVATLGMLGQLLDYQGRAGEAVPLLRTAADLQAARHGDAHESTLAARSNLAHALNRSGQNAEAAEILGRAVPLQVAAFGADHPNTRVMQSVLAGILLELGRLDEAEPLVRDSLAGLRRSRGERHLDTMAALNRLGELLRRRDLPGEALEPLREAHAIARDLLGAENLTTIMTLHNLGVTELDAGDLPAATADLEQVVAGARSTLGAEHKFTAYFQASCARALLQAGRAADAKAVLEPALPILVREYGADSSVVLEARAALEQAGRLSAVGREGGSDG